MSKVLPFIIGIIIGFGVMFIIQFLRKKKGAGSTNRILGFSYSPNTVSYTHLRAHETR